MKYRLLKDLPWCPAGEIFERKDDKFTLPHAPDLYTSDIRNIDEWFEKAKELTINDIDWNFDPKPGDICYSVDNAGNILSWFHVAEDEKAEVATGNRFRTEQEAEAYKRWLKAVAELRRSSGFKPDWNDSTERKYFVYYEGGLHINYWDDRCIGTAVYYSTFEDTEQSIRKHKDAWLTYFGVNK